MPQLTFIEAVYQYILLCMTMSSSNTYKTNCSYQIVRNHLRRDRLHRLGQNLHLFSCRNYFIFIHYKVQEFHCQTIALKVSSNPTRQAAPFLTCKIPRLTYFTFYVCKNVIQNVFCFVRNTNRRFDKSCTV